MFYSATLLGQKGPLATVWQAATIKTNLKKSHYTSTDILSSVELIMYPNIPLALRQSAYLLLGVVRIHSKQVEYFLKECKTIEAGIRKAFLPTNVNLPEDATHAPYPSITLPERFELDASGFDDDLDLNRFEDTRLKSCDEITSKDQILTRDDEYVGIFIDEDTGRSLSRSGEASGSGALPMETDSDPSNIDGISAQSLNEGNSCDHIPQDDPDIEIMCDAVHDHGFENVPLCPDQWNDVTEPDNILEESIMKDKETASLLVDEEMMEQDEPPSTTSAEVQQLTNRRISFVHQSPELVLRSTPPPPEEPKARRRRRKLLVDDAIILSKDQIRRQLGDTSGLKRQRKKAPSSSLDLWKLNKRRRKDGKLSEPLITGLCDDLYNIYKEDFISSKTKMASSQENDLGIEIERLRDNQDQFECTNLLSEILPSPMSTPSSSRRDNFTPSSWYNEGLDVEDSVLSDTPEFHSSAEDLSFLNQEDRTPIISELRTISTERGGTPEFDALPARTRAVAQFLQGKSPVTPNSEDTGDLSLDTILQGKNKKICARMFYETLVLKNCELVNVKQNEAYGDITLEVTSGLKELFSS